MREALQAQCALDDNHHDDYSNMAHIRLIGEKDGLYAECQHCECVWKLSEDGKIEHKEIHVHSVHTDWNSVQPQFAYNHGTVCGCQDMFCSKRGVITVENDFIQTPPPGYDSWIDFYKSRAGELTGLLDGPFPSHIELGPRDGGENNG